MTKVLEKTMVLENCDPENIPDEVYASTQPIILKGLVNNWPLVKAGMESSERAIELLKSCYSGKLASVYFAEPGITRFAYNEDLSALNFEIRKADISGMLDEILSTIDYEFPPIRYIASNIIDIYFPTLIEEHSLPFTGRYFDEHPLELADPLKGIWIGNKTLSPCHYDAQSNIACCVVGKRKFTLFPPNQIHNLYPGPLDLTPGGPAITMVDFDNPDFEKYPRYKDAIDHGQIAELEAGDAIFIPCMWWHQVQALSPFNVLINYWWNSFPKIRGQAMNALNLAIMSIRDRPEQEKQAWKHLFDYYVFGDNRRAGEHLPESARNLLGDINDDIARQMRAQLLQKLNR